MAKRAKKAAKAADAARKAATKPEEPFFRPFAKLKAARPDKKKATSEASQPSAPAGKTAASSKASHAASTTTAASAVTAASARKPARPERPAEAEDEPIVLVDPDTFAIYMAGVKPLRERSTRIPVTAHRVERAPRPAPTTDPDDEARAKMRSLVEEGIRFETTDDGERIEGRRMDVDPRELRRLRHGRYAIDGKLDLHGLALDDARRAAEAFVKKRALDGDKVVVIVHGKGSHSPRQLGVLRGEIGAWLSQGRASRHVRAFATAPADEGGSGALLVLLAR